MSHALSTEASSKFGRAVMMELDVDPGRVHGDSVTVEVYGDTARVEWRGVATMPAETIKRILAEVQEPTH